jgi:glycerol-3-phosphate cytidylyltransferase
MRYCFDLDGTICKTPLNENGKPDYVKSVPIPIVVNQLKKLREEGHYIIIQTARGRSSGIDWTEWTEQQLEKWKVPYDDLEPMFHKPNADFFIDDKGVDVSDWLKMRPLTKGIVAGAFDLIHPGYIRMFNHAKQYCNYLVVALHENPTSERSWKMSPVQSVEDRVEILLALSDVDEVLVYKEENQFLDHLASGEYEIRFLGEDYSDGSYTGKEIGVPIVWVPRNHGYSTTKLKGRIYQQYGELGT